LLFGNKNLISSLSFKQQLMTTAFATALQLTKDWFGIQHVKAILRLIGKETLSLVLSEILQNMSLKVFFACDQAISKRIHFSDFFLLFLVTECALSVCKRINGWFSPKD
jgi:hypothetical protein